MGFAERNGMILGWLVLLLCMSCASPTAAPQEPTRIQSVVPTTIGTHPISISWQLATNPTGTNGESSIAVHFMVIDGARATIIYSFAGDAALQAEFADNIQLRDNTGRAYALAGKTVLAELENVQLGSLTFEGLTAQANRLALAFEPALRNPLVVDIAALDPANAKVNYVSGVQFTMGRNGQFEQSGYGITFNGFFLNKGEVVSGQPSTPSEPSAVTLELSEGKPIASEATLRVETMQTGEVQFLYILILRDGQVRFRFLE